MPNPAVSKSLTRSVPRKGCEQIPTQQFGSGVEKHDDAVDASVYLIFGIAGEGISPQDVQYI
jgi:hypothetical protein